MGNDGIYSKAELLRIASVPEDAFVFWERQSLIHGQQKGPRAHKRYTRREVKFAAILGEARLTGMNVATMREMMASVRTAFEYFDTLPSASRVADLIGHLGNRKYYLDGAETYGYKDLEASKEWHLTTDFVQDMVDRGWIKAEEKALYYKAQDLIDLNRTAEYWIASIIDDGDGDLAVYRDKEGCLRLDVVEGKDLTGTKSSLTFYLRELLALPWPEAMPAGSV